MAPACASERAAMTRKRKAILILSILGVLLAAWFIGGLLNLGWLMRPIPYRYMWVMWSDVDGMTALETEKFTVSFEGASFGRRMHSGRWLIDGRYHNWTPWPDNTTLKNVLQRGQDEEMGYLDSQRLFAANYLGHEIRYFDYRRLLVVDGREFSLDGGPVHVVIAPSGEMRLAPFVPSEMIAAMKAADRTKAP